MPVKPLSFKGDKKSSSRKRKHDSSTALTTTTSTSTTHSQDPTNEDDDSWTSPNIPSDLSGPTLLVLSTIPPTCLASDSHGNVFASQIENMIDSDPRTSEPHDVRQVWVASKIAGMGDGEVGFKGSHGGWLGCDEYGILAARREARGVEENFRIELVVAAEEDARKGQWRIRTAASTDKENRYLCAITESPSSQANDPDPSTKKVSISLRGDAGSTTTTKDPDPTLMHIKMQSRFLPLTHKQQSDARAKEKISRRELETAVGRKLDDDEVRKLKRAKRQGDFHEELLGFRAKGKHDKFA